MTIQKGNLSLVYSAPEEPKPTLHDLENPDSIPDAPLRAVQDPTTVETGSADRKKSMSKRDRIGMLVVGALMTPLAVVGVRDWAHNQSNADMQHDQPPTPATASPHPGTEVTPPESHPVVAGGTVVNDRPTPIQPMMPQGVEQPHK